MKRMVNTHEAVFFGKEETLIYNFDSSWMQRRSTYGPTKYLVSLEAHRRYASSKNIVIYDGEVQGGQLKVGDIIVLPHIGPVEILQLAKKVDGTTVYYTDYARVTAGKDTVESIRETKEQGEKLVNKRIESLAGMDEDEIDSLKNT
ncbi:hypothetical protein, partial [Staphylococcus epidermidis]